MVRVPPRMNGCARCSSPSTSRALDALESAKEASCDEGSTHGAQVRLALFRPLHVDFREGVKGEVR